MVALDKYNCMALHRKMTKFCALSLGNCLSFLSELLLNVLCTKKSTPKSKVDVKKNLHEEMLKKTRYGIFFRGPACNYHILYCFSVASRENL